MLARAPGGNLTGAAMRCFTPAARWFRPDRQCPYRLEWIPDLESYDMLRSKLFAAGVLASFLSPAAMYAADNVEYVREKDGREYMITKQVVSRPMSKTEYK